MTYQHRISWQQPVSEPLLDRGILTIGFSCVSHLDFLTKATLVAQTVYDLDDDVRRGCGSLLRERHSLWRFLHMPHGARVLVPGSGAFSIYRIADDGPSLIRQLAAVDLDGLETTECERVERRANGFLCVGDCQIDLGFFRRVELIAENIGRSDFVDRALAARMKARQTTLDISDLESSVEASLAAWKRQTPLSLRARIMDQMPERLLELIYGTLNDVRFEALVRLYFERLGATQVDVLPKNQADKEGDADVTAIFEPLRTIYHVQAKFHEPGSQTDQWAVEQVKAYVEHRRAAEEEDGYARVPWVVSTCGDFDPDCQKLATEHRVTLINGKAFAQMLLDAGIDNLDL